MDNLTLNNLSSKPLVSFDYGIKYLLRDKGDYTIVEGFISALLGTVGYRNVKILALLESESNREDSKSKRSLADLIVQDEDGSKYIIEIERNVKDSFIHKSLFNTSRLIIDNLAQREDYTQILKVFHISLLYFPIGGNSSSGSNKGGKGSRSGEGGSSNDTTNKSGGGAIYHGKTIIHEIENNDRLAVHIKNQQGEVVDATDILPEYFYISVPLFNDRLEKEIDDWLHVMKYDEVPNTYHSPYMAQVAEKLSILKMTKEERARYSYYQKQLHTDRDELHAAEARGKEQGLKEGEARGMKAGEAKGKAEGKIEGIAEGIKQGIEEGETKGKVEGITQGKIEEKIAIARNLLAQNIDANIISAVTGLSNQEVEKLKS